MLTPVDIQQKRFKTGLGYDKKDVNTFFTEVAKSYEELYRSNADLKEKVITLTDGLQHYKATEDNLQKTLMLAEKNKQEAKTLATKEAKNIELEAKNRANEIVNEAYEQLEELELRMQELESRYAEYKSMFAALVKAQTDIIELQDFDPDAHIDPNFGGMSYSGGGSSSSDDGGFNSDPQMRESSSLGGGSFGGGSGLGGAGSVGGSRESRRSNSSNVYGSTLGGDGIDPFGEGKKSSSSSTSTKSTATASKPKSQPKTQASSAASAASTVKSRKEEVIPPKKEKKEDGTASKEEAPKKEASSNEATNNDAEPKAKPTRPVGRQEKSEDESLSGIQGDIQEKKTKTTLIDDPDKPKHDDEDDGFEFI